jgi:hypothetical protein
MASVTKRGSKWYAMWRGADGRLVQKVTQAHAKAEAVVPRQFTRRAPWGAHKRTGRALGWRSGRWLGTPSPRRDGGKKLKVHDSLLLMLAAAWS